MIEIKPATLDDLDWIVSELETFSSHHKRKYRFWSDEDYARKFMTEQITNHLVLLAWSGAVRIGFVSGWVMNHALNPNIRLLTEVFWWVVPTERKSGAGLKLLEKFTEWGEDNCDLINFTLSRDTEMSDRSLLKLGYGIDEVVFYKEV
jgi:hypothetical protein